MSRRYIVVALGVWSLAGCGGGGDESQQAAGGVAPPPQAQRILAPVEAMTPPAALEARANPRRAAREPAPVIRLGAGGAQQAQTGKESARPGAPRRTGFGRTISATADAAGTTGWLNWHATPEGGKVASIGFISGEAVALRLGILVRRLPPEAVLRFYSPSGDTTETASGAEILASIQRNAGAGDTTPAGRTWWAPLVQGEEATLEIELPPGVDIATVEVAVPRLSHFTSSPTSSLREQPQRLVGQAAACELDVSCYSYPSESSATAKMSYVGSDGGSYTCTGTLLNDRGSSGTPYFLSANHCISKQTSASSLQTFWFYKSASCNGGTLSTSYRTLSGGATLLYASSSTDTSFMRLSGTPPAGASYAGWSPNALTISNSVTGVHHPRGDLQKISFGSVRAYNDCTFSDPNSLSFSCRSATQSTSEFVDVNFSSGTTESGSSGSGLFQSVGSSRYLVGQLQGGTSSCSNLSGSNYYGRFDVAYNAALHQWLDAGSTFALTVSKAGNGNGAISSSPSAIACGLTCAVPFASGATVVLTATPDPGSTFTGWSGACTGTGTCTLLMSSAQSVTATFAIPVVSLGSALDNTSLSWTTGGNASFRAQTSFVNFGSSAAQSGAIGGGQSSYLSTTVTGPGVLTFDWKVSSEADYDVFTVYLNGATQWFWSGQTSWFNSSITIPAGTHTVRWEYVKDASLSSGQDAGWVDRVVFTPTSTTSETTPLYNWVEGVLPAIFPRGTGVAGNYLDYSYRYYPTTAVFLAVRNGRVLVHDGRRWNLLDVGALTDLLRVARAAGYS